MSLGLVACLEALARRVRSLTAVLASDRFDGHAPRRYDLDRRHAGLLKAHGAQRQGVQWSDREIDERAAAIERGEYLSEEENEHVALPSPDKKPAAGSPEARSMRNFDKEAEDALKSVKYDLSPRSKKRCQAEAEGFRAAARPDDARLYVMRHRAAFHDLLLLVGRVNAYRQRLEDLKGQRMKLDQEKRQCNDVLGYLHREIFTCEVHLKQVEKDLIGASKVMQVGDSAFH